MSIKISKQGKEVCFNFPEALTILEVAGLHKEILKKLNRITYENAVISLKKTEKCDTAGLQLIVSLIKTFQNENVHIKEISLSDVVEKMGERTGIYLQKI